MILAEKKQSARQPKNGSNLRRVHSLSSDPERSFVSNKKGTEITEDEVGMRNSQEFPLEEVKENSENLFEALKLLYSEGKYQ